MSTDYISLNSILNDHDLTLAIPGEVESVRRRLVDALQKVGYKVLSEHPLYAKRGGHGSACWDCSVNALDYPTTLTISLKQTNDLAVLATFDYEVKSYIHLTRGDRQTLACEAEAIAALATERLAISACRACGTQVNDESHFCRRCGAPLVLDIPELEVLRLTRGSRDSYHKLFIGVTSLLLAALTALPIFIVSGARIYGPFLWAGIPLAIYALFNLAQGMWALHHTLNPKSQVSARIRRQPEIASSVTTALPPEPLNASITEGTTQLLSTSENRVAEPIRRKDPSTAEIEIEREM